MQWYQTLGNHAELTLASPAAPDPVTPPSGVQAMATALCNTHQEGYTMFMADMDALQTESASAQYPNSFGNPTVVTTFGTVPLANLGIAL